MNQPSIHLTFDIHFQTDTHMKAMNLRFRNPDDAFQWVQANPKVKYFEAFKGGFVDITCIETGEIVHTEPI